jgi:hypothetical protein
MREEVLLGRVNSLRKHSIMPSEEVCTTHGCEPKVTDSLLRSVTMPTPLMVMRVPPNKEPCAGVIDVITVIHSNDALDNDAPRFLSTTRTGPIPLPGPLAMHVSCESE